MIIDEYWNVFEALIELVRAAAKELGKVGARERETEPKSKPQFFSL